MGKLRAAGLRDAGAIAHEATGNARPIRDKLRADGHRIAHARALIVILDLLIFRPRRGGGQRCTKQG